MDKVQKDNILDKAKVFFKEVIMQNHVNNTLKLRAIKEFNLNPFLYTYLANYLTGNSKPKSIAKALIYPRVLGTSISTSFGQNFQTFCSTVLEGFGSTTTGIDIEFIDQIDNRKKYCQIKSGPQTINKDDVKTICDHFSGIKNLARTNSLQLLTTDMVVGVFYGVPADLSGHYKEIEKEYSVFVGKEFWERLTGDESFYVDLYTAVGEVAQDADCRNFLEDVIDTLSEYFSI